MPTGTYIDQILDRPEYTERVECEFTATITVTRTVITSDLEDTERANNALLAKVLEDWGYTVTINESNIEPK